MQQMNNILLSFNGKPASVGNVDNMQVDENKAFLQAFNQANQSKPLSVSSITASINVDDDEVLSTTSEIEKLSVEGEIEHIFAQLNMAELLRNNSNSGGSALPQTMELNSERPLNNGSTSANDFSSLLSMTLHDSSVTKANIESENAESTGRDKLLSQLSDSDLQKLSDLLTISKQNLVLMSAPELEKAVAQFGQLANEITTKSSKSDLSIDVTNATKALPKNHHDEYLTAVSDKHAQLLMASLGDNTGPVVGKSNLVDGDETTQLQTSLLGASIRATVGADNQANLDENTTLVAKNSAIATFLSSPKDAVEAKQVLLSTDEVILDTVNSKIQSASGLAEKDKSPSTLLQPLYIQDENPDNDIELSALTKNVSKLDASQVQANVWRGVADDGNLPPTNTEDSLPVDDILQLKVPKELSSKNLDVGIVNQLKMPDATTKADETLFRKIQSVVSNIDQSMLQAPLDKSSDLLNASSFSQSALAPSKPVIQPIISINQAIDVTLAGGVEVESVEGINADSLKTSDSKAESMLAKAEMSVTLAVADNVTATKSTSSNGIEFATISDVKTLQNQSSLTPVHKSEVPQFQLSLKAQAEANVHMQDLSQRFSPLMKQQLITMVSNGIQQAEIRLDPPELGHMLVKIQVNGEQTQVQFHVAQAQTRDVVEQAMPRLREMLAQEGLQLADSHVSHGNSGNSGKDQQESNNGGMNENHLDEISAQDAHLHTKSSMSSESTIDYYA